LLSTNGREQLLCSSAGEVDRGKIMHLLNQMSKMRVFLFKRSKIKVFLNEEKGGWISVAFSSFLETLNLLSLNRKRTWIKSLYTKLSLISIKK
jgi:hypothetical protein